ncbi:iron transporter [Vibrio tubiashii]|nr:iron transporter [Vibrio tubiashii]
MKTQLDKLKPGNKGVIVSHGSRGAIRQRLLDLGLIPEMEIEFVRYAPLGDPLEVRVGLTNVVIRKAEAQTVMIKLDC